MKFPYKQAQGGSGGIATIPNNEPQGGPGGSGGYDIGGYSVTYIRLEDTIVQQQTVKDTKELISEIKDLIVKLQTFSPYNSQFYKRASEALEKTRQLENLWNK
jgi:hypothetical protein